MASLCYTNRTGLYCGSAASMIFLSEGAEGELFMKREEVANHLKAFDPEIYALLEEERQRQRYTLSLLGGLAAQAGWKRCAKMM